MKNLRYNDICLRALTILCLLMASVGAWAADYVLAYVNGGTTYYLARNGTTGVARTNTFNPTTCIWSCENADGTASTLNNSNTYGYLYQTVNGTKYYLYADVNAFSLKTDRATNNYSRMRTNGTYVYNRYSGTYSYYINLANNAPARNTTANTASNARPYQVTTNSVAVNNNGITAPTISCSDLSGSAGIQLSRTGVGGSYIPAHTTYAFNNQTIYYYNNTAYTNTNQFAVSVNANDATYNWSVTAGTANVSTTGVVTLGNNNTQNVTVRCRATINGVNKDATYTLNATATAALNETAYSDIEITPSSQTLDLGEEVTYTVSPSISQVTKTRPQYVSVTDAQGHTHYKVGTTYQAVEPTITETPGAAINFTSFSWSAAEGGAYFTLEPYYSNSSNKVTLTRTAQKTGTQQTFTISVTGVYGSQNKTASATVTIPATQVDLTALHAGEAINLGVGSSESINGHYTYEPDYDAAGAPYLEFKYKSNNESVATVDASGKVTAVGPGSTTITITAVKLDGTDGVTCDVTVNVAIDAPTISIDGSGNVTITHPVPGVQIRYTTNGTDPTATTGTVYTASFKAGNEQTIKAIAVANGVASAVASEFYATSGVSGTKVIINDYEDHNWTYYAGVDSEVDDGNYNTNYKGKLYSPNPRNVKITYYGKGRVATSDDVNGTYADISNDNDYTVKVGINEPENTFVYYKTLERDNNSRYPYTTIPNPFSVRPVYGTNATTKWRGFYRWRIKTLTDGSIYTASTGGTALAVGSYLEPDKEYYFQPSDYNNDNYTINGTSMTVELEAVWVRAYVNTTNSNTNFVSKANGGWERNFVVYTSGTGNTATGFANYPVTYTALYPNGTTNGTTAANTIPNVSVATNMTLAGDVKIENIRMNGGTTLSANWYNLWVVRNTIGSGTNGVSAQRLTGVDNTTTKDSPQYTLRIESGTYNYFDVIKGHNTDGGTGNTNYSISGTATNARAFVGSDYDRAKNDNSLLNVVNQLQMGCGGSFTNSANCANEHTMDMFIKSGTIGSKYWIENTNTATQLQGGMGRGCYMGSSSTATNTGRRNVTVEGGDICAIGGGYEGANNRNYLVFNLRIMGGTVHGNIYGGASQSPAYGSRRFVFTGGRIMGWVAPGCNGTSSDGGQTNGESFAYIGGNTRVDSGTNTKKLGYACGGNVYAAGAGREGTSTCGEMTYGTNLVIADDCYIQRGAYGGGNYGYANVHTNIYITGGTNAGQTDTQAGNAKGGVFGGSNQQDGPEIKIWMTGGKMLGGVYGGCNTEGNITGNVTMQINGGQVGTNASNTANIHGGGYGNGTVVNQNIDITLGKTGAERDADGVTVWGDVYGGSALGSVNGETATNNYHTNVTMNAGYIHGSLYGGALGNAGTAANVYGPVQVKVYGGSVWNTDGTGANGSGAVYGANNINGAPQRSVTVDIYGTNSAPAEGEYALFSVYGGGNQANYTYGNGYPKVTVHNCDNSIEYVYGGGNAAAVAATDVTIYGGDKIGNVFGGGNGQVKAANVNGNTNVKIYGGTIGDVYGGSNTNGTIGGTISVTVNKTAEDGGDGCDMKIDNVYGGGNKAASNVGSVIIGCTGTKDGEGINAVYGGANQANITGNIDLRINSGTINNVFGGNNTSGTISGTITVTVNENTSAGCGKAMEVGNVYGGGNKAAYGTGTNYPVVNIQNGHLTGSVFGGGLGETAVVTGNPQVTIGQPSAGTVHIDGNVFGGGDAANVVGKPVVLVQNCNTQIGTKTDGVWNSTGGTVYGGGNAAHVTGAGNGTSVTINGGDINRVFGGGNGEESAANVEGNAVTTIHAGNIHQAFAGSNMRGNISGSATITVDHSNEGCDELIDEVYGGGNRAAGNAGTVTIDCGANIGDVYGGANAADINSDITLNITGGTIDRVFGGNNTSGNISGAITVNVNKSNTCDLDLNYVYGAGNQASYTPSTPGAYPAVNILKGTVKQDVFGGGLGATAIVTSNPTVTVNGGTVSGNVFGGGSLANTVGITSVTVQTGNVSKDVYGGGALADVEGNTTVAVTGGTVTGNTYGGGLGQLADAEHSLEAVAANVSGTTTVIVSGGTVNSVFGCNNVNGAPQTGATVTTTGGTINNVYGGGNLAAANVAPVVNILNGTVNHNVFGGGLGTTAVVTAPPQVTIGDADHLTDDTYQVIVSGDVYGGGDAAAVEGVPVVTVVNKCNTQIGNVYGGGNAADVKGTDVTINGGKITGMVFGGGHGNKDAEPAVAANVNGDVSLIVTGGTVNSVYAGSNSMGDITGDVSFTINKGTDSCPMHITEVYGGGNQAAGNAATIDIICTGGADEGIQDVYGGANAADINNDINLNITGGNIQNIFGGNNNSGNIKGAIAVTINQDGNSCGINHIDNVYGGGNKAPYSVYGYNDDGTVIESGTAAYTQPVVTITNGTINQDVYGGGLGVTAKMYADPIVEIQGGTVTRNVFGGGSLADTYGTTTINVTGGTVTHDVYGGGALANVNGNTEVNLTGGSVGGAYGGGLGSETVAALVTGDATVTLNGSAVTGDGIFGANNVNGTPKGHVFVHVLSTVPAGNGAAYHVPAVYGGGNQAAYQPTSADDFAEVLIENCDNSIEYVYGGGNAAPVPATKVTIKGANAINNAFAGGNGYGDGNPGADVGYLGYFSKGSATTYGTGTAEINVHGGTVNNVYGGSNTLGYIRGGTTVNVEDEDEACELHVGNVFGGGNEAPIYSDITLKLDCSEGGTILYGGANDADVGNITLNIVSGTFGKVFCGNNKGGAVKGKLTVNVDETGCWPVMIGELYGGGNMAAYSVFGYQEDANGTTLRDGNGRVIVKTSGTQLYEDPEVNLISFTRIGKVFGGGYGNTADIYGNTHVNVDPIKGIFAGQTPNPLYKLDAQDLRVPNTSGAISIPNAVGTIGKIYGGGNAGAVYGDTHVNIGFKETNKHISGADQTTEQEVAVNITGDVFGGGNEAIVSGDTHVTIGQ